ncbi:hypothetical protein [Nitrospira moscoviensis]|uniref:Uncharacterized protein n=1 Tax=Nitrospira moscoviensis TaxID=42253 RepID=A0A0K2GH78_NITMO|nr:hypothetical protein [Nitrospira moscoviensis]ALA60318.1 hypothetical protein NITMOv2_3933 [Nitrospira moscoviensis]
MIRHPDYLDIPWDIHWRTEPQQHHGFGWWLVAASALLALFLIGVRVTSGTLG